MVRYENDCVDCGLPCLGSACPNRNVKHLYCDNCKSEVEELYEYDDSELCEECLLNMFFKITCDD